MKNPYQEAVELTSLLDQDSVRVLQALDENLKLIEEDLRCRGLIYSIGAMNSHSLTVIYLDRLVGLTRRGYVKWDEGDREFTKALNECRILAKEWSARYDDQQKEEIETQEAERPELLVQGQELHITVPIRIRNGIVYIPTVTLDYEYSEDSDEKTKD
jgi:hypothetical protein